MPCTCGEYSDPLIDSEPWEEHVLGGPHKALTATQGTGDKSRAAKCFNQWLKGLHPLDILVYTDGSQEIDRAGTPTGVGAAWVLKSNNVWIGKAGISLGKTTEVYDSEATAMCKGFEAALTHPATRGAPGIHVCLDNPSVAQNAGSVTQGSSQSVFKRFRDNAKWWLRSGKRLTVQWIPSHSGIIGNEIADLEARTHAKVLSTTGTQGSQTIASYKRTIRSQRGINWIYEWGARRHSGSVQKYKDLGLKPTTRVKALPELSICREVFGWLIATRSGHGHFAAYHERFGHDERDLNCQCGQRRSQLHPFFCPNAREHRSKLWCKKLKRQLTPGEILGTSEGVLLFAEWAPATGFFRRIRSHGEPEEN